MVEDVFFKHIFEMTFIVSYDKITIQTTIKHTVIVNQCQALKQPKGRPDTDILPP